MRLEVARQEVAQVVKRNGAWLIGFDSTISVAESATPDELFDCAGSLMKAKSVAVKMGKGFGYKGPHRWEQITEHDWRLLMIVSAYL